MLCDLEPGRLPLWASVSSSVPIGLVYLSSLWLRAELRRGHPAQSAQWPFQPSQVTKSRQGPSREELPWAPPAHSHSLSLEPNRAQDLERNRQSSCSQPSWAHNPLPVLEGGKRNRLNPRTVQIPPWGLHSSVLHASLLPRSTGLQALECQTPHTLQPDSFHSRRGKG